MVLWSCTVTPGIISLGSAASSCELAGQFGKAVLLRVAIRRAVTSGRIPSTLLAQIRSSPGGSSVEFLHHLAPRLPPDATKTSKSVVFFRNLHVMPLAWEPCHSIDLAFLSSWVVLVPPEMDPGLNFKLCTLELWDL